MVGGTLAALLVLVIVVALGSRFFGQQGPPHLPSNIFHLPPVPSSLQFLRGQNPGGVSDLVSSSSSTLPPPPPSSILYSHDSDELPAASKPSNPQVAWNWHFLFGTHDYGLSSHPCNNIEIYFINNILLRYWVNWGVSSGGTGFLCASWQKSSWTTVPAKA